jgi:hypothetical protein
MAERSTPPGPRARPPGDRVEGWADLSLVDEQPDCLAVGEVDHHHALLRRVAAVAHRRGRPRRSTARLTTPPDHRGARTPGA